MKNLLLNLTIIIFSLQQTYLLLHKTTINTKLCVFQYKILNNVLYLNKMLFRCRKVRSPSCYFCKSSEETLFYFHKIFFSNYFTIPNISPQSAILAFMEEIQDHHYIIINHTWLIYKHYVYLSRNLGSLNFIGLKNYILETNILEAQNDPHKKCNFLKK